MDKKRIIRFTQHNFTTLKTHLKAADKKESLAFMLFSQAFGSDDEILIANTLILPDEREMKKQTRISVEPTMRLQTVAYGLAYDKEMIPGDAHTHPFQQIPKFSSIDDYYGERNARGVSKLFAGDTTMVMLVLGNDFEHFDARIWDKRKSKLVKIDRLEILGTPIQILEGNESEVETSQDPYERQLRIPGWKQGRLGQIKVFVAGLGGNGSLIWMSLLALGVGAGSGWIKGCDPDVLEASNLPRIPYASPNDVGKPKAEVAEAYARFKTPGTNAVCYPSQVDDVEIQNIIKEANVIIGCIDNDGARKTCNQLVSRYVIPLIDLATEIIPQEGEYEAIGQVRIVIPGQTGCLMCSDTIDPTEAALDQATERVKKVHAKLGYIRGTDETPTPSVLHLNGTVSHLGISHFVRLVFDEQLKGKEFLHYDRQKCQLIAASVPLNKDCPVCGEHGYLAAGDEKSLIIPPDEISGKNLTIISKRDLEIKARNLGPQSKMKGNNSKRGKPRNESSPAKSNEAKGDEA